MNRQRIIYMCEFGLGANILVGIAFLMAIPTAYFTNNPELAEFFFFGQAIFELIFGTWGGLKLSHTKLNKENGEIKEWYSHFNLGVSLFMASVCLILSGVAYLTGIFPIAKMLWGFSAALYLVFGSWGGLRLNGLKYDA